MTKLWNPFFNKASPFELINLSCLRGKIEKESLRLKCAIRGSRKKRERERDKINGDKIGSKRPVLDLVRVATCYGGDTGNFAITRSHEYIYIYIYTCDSADSRLNDTPPYASRDYTSERRMRSLAIEVTGTEERAVKRAAVPELEASSTSSRPNSLLERESNMPVLTRACTTATLPRIKRFKFASFGEFTYSVYIYMYFSSFSFFFSSFNLGFLSPKVL